MREKHVFKKTEKMEFQEDGEARQSINISTGRFLYRYAEDPDGEIVEWRKEGYCESELPDVIGKIQGHAWDAKTTRIFRFTSNGLQWCILPARLQYISYTLSYSRVDTDCCTMKELIENMSFNDFLELIYDWREKYEDLHC